MSILDLPSDVLFHIFKRLDAEGLRACARTCQAFSTYLQQPKVWRLLILARFGPTVEVEEEEGLVDIRRRYARLGRSRVRAKDLSIIHGPSPGSYHWQWVDEGEKGDSERINTVVKLNTVSWMDVSAMFYGVPAGRYRARWRMRLYISNVGMYNVKFGIAVPRGRARVEVDPWRKEEPTWSDVFDTYPPSYRDEETEAEKEKRKQAEARRKARQLDTEEVVDSQSLTYVFQDLLPGPGPEPSSTFASVPARDWCIHDLACTLVLPRTFQDVRLDIVNLDWYDKHGLVSSLVL